MDIAGCFGDFGSCPHPPPPAAVEFFLEDGFLADPFPADALWQEPNTFPLLQIDIRGAYDIDGTWAYAGGHIEPGDFGRSVANRVQWFFDALAATWPAGKPRRYALLVKAFDAADADRYIALHADDRYSATQPTPWSEAARTESRPYMQDCWGEARQMLMDASLPMPARLFSDIETSGDVQGLCDVLWPAILADARYSNKLFDGTQTVQAWAASHTTDENGTAIPAFDSGYGPYHPQNWAFASRCIAAVRRGYAYALEQILYEPFRATFGRRPCGEWGITTSKRARPVLFRPGQVSAHDDGAGPSMLIPTMYAKPQTFRPSAAGLDADTRWETLANYETVYGAAGATVEARTCEQGRRSGRAMIQQIRAASSAAIVPSVSQGEVGRTAHVLDGDAAARKAVAAPIVAGYIADAWARGAEAFWLFEEYWRSSAIERTAVAAYVAQANARITAGNFT